jgi:hypothetical protein
VLYLPSAIEFEVPPTIVFQKPAVIEFDSPPHIQAYHCDPVMEFDNPATTEYPLFTVFPLPIATDPLAETVFNCPPAINPKSPDVKELLEFPDLNLLFESYVKLAEDVKLFPLEKGTLFAENAAAAAQGKYLSSVL